MEVGGAGRFICAVSTEKQVFFRILNTASRVIFYWDSLTVDANESAGAKLWSLHLRTPARDREHFGFEPFASGDFFSESDPRMTPVLLYWKFKS